MNLLDFFSREAGQQRRKWLDETVGGAIEYITPPNLRPAVNLAAQMNPIQGMGDAMQAGEVLFSPEATADARKRAALDMGIEIAMAATPAALAKMGYMAAPQALAETFAMSGDALAEKGRGLLSDAQYAGRSIAQGDPRGVLEAFQRGGTPQSVGASAAGPNELIGYDNPQGDWLQRKVKLAEENISEGGVGITGPTTAYTKQSVMLPVDQLSSLKGAMGEKPAAGQVKYDDLMQSVQKEGFTNNSPILVGVNHRGEPYIVEGNNRVAVAKAMGVDRIPAEVRWYNGGEDIATNWSPQAVEGMLSSSNLKPASVASGDPKGVLEAFQRGGKPQSVGAARVGPAGEVMNYADVEVLDPRDFIGAKFTPTPADLTKTGGYYEGIDAAGTTRVTPLMGGPLFPLQQVYRDANIGWLVDSKSKGSTKLGKDADFITVSAMSPKAHQSNRTIADAYMGTLEAYIKNDRLSDQAVGELNNIVKDFGKSTKSDDMRKLGTFVGFDSPMFDDWMRSATFEQREMVSKLMTSPAALKAGGPNFQKILDATIQPEFAGSNLGDTLLVLKPNKERGLLDLAQEGLPTHPSYDVGFGADVVGRFENPVSRGYMYPDFEAEYSSRPTMIRPDGSVDQSKMAYSFGRALPVQEMTPEGARNIFDAIQYYNIDQPKQAQLIDQALAGAWRSSMTPKNKGGISAVDFERALLRNPSLPSLEPYTAADVKAGAKAGDFEVFQLGDADMYFGLKKNPDYTWMNDGKPIPELGDNEVDLVGVISNEMGAKGVASPAVMGKAIEQGATVLNAFAVPSERFPDGFLPNVYGGYGFKEVKRIPFSKEYYIEERGQAAFDDLVRQWRSEGWDESKGFPDVILMKWSGTDAQRAEASQRVFDEGFSGFGTGEDIGSIKSAGQNSQPSLQAATGSQASGQNIGRGDTGSVRSGGGASQSSGIRGAAAELRQLTPEQRKNLGLLTMGF